MFTRHTSSARRGLRDLAFLYVVGISLLALLNGCGAVHTSIAKANLEVSTKMSDAVFLDPVGPDQRTLFVQVRNTSDQPSFTIEPAVKAAIAGKGYRIVDDPNRATFKLQAQILSVAKTDPTSAAAALNAGYGGAIAGAVLGGTIGGAVGGTRGLGIGAGAGGLVGGLAETVANAMVKDVLFVAITDIQISQRRRKAFPVPKRRRRISPRAPAQKLSNFLMKS